MTFNVIRRMIKNIVFVSTNFNYSSSEFHFRLVFFALFRFSLILIVHYYSSLNFSAPLLLSFVVPSVPFVYPATSTKK
jgi:hypothetical protein